MLSVFDVDVGDDAEEEDDVDVRPLMVGCADPSVVSDDEPLITAAVPAAV